MDFGAREAHPVLPGVHQDLSGDGGLAKHRQRRGPAFEQFQQLDEHRFRNVKVAFAGNRIQAVMVLEIRLFREISASQHAELCVRNPRGITDDEGGFRSVAKEGCPICVKETSPNHPYLVCVGGRVQGNSKPVHVCRVNLDTQPARRHRESIEGAEQEGADSTSGFDHKSRRKPPTRKELANLSRQRDGRLEVAEFVCFHI